MTTFLFWNVFRKDLSERLARLIVVHEVDVVMVVESGSGGAALASRIAASGGPSLTAHGFDDAKARVLSRLRSDAIVEISTDPLGRLRIYEARLPGLPEVLLAVAHLPSPASVTQRGLNQSATYWAGRIRSIETQLGHRRTILVGDLNMNPFDEGMVSGYGFHAVMTRSKALERARLIDGLPRPFFYNPMWGRFGDQTPGPPGTYYLSGTGPVNYFWNMYDQVLVRPDLIPNLHDVMILDYDGSERLLTAGGLPGKRLASDHLPLLFRIRPL